MPDPGNVQSYNRYGYALGNPIKYNDPSGHCGTSVMSGGSTAALDIACLEALGEAIAAVASEVAPPVAAAGATAAVGAGAYLAASWAIQDNGPIVPPIQPERLPDDGFTVTIPVPNSSTVTSGVPLGTGADASIPGITANTGPSLQLVDPLPKTQTGTNLMSSSMTGDQKALKELVDETTQGGRKPLTVNEAETILDWADEVSYPGWRAKSGE